MSTTSTHYDVAVVGGGIMGMSAAYSLLKRGIKRVEVLERHTVAHDRAASTDWSKAIRYEYADNLQYSQMVGRSIELWRELEAQSGEGLYVNCGVACWGRGDIDLAHARRSFITVSKMGIPIREVSPEELCRIYPQFAQADISYATVNPEGGFLRAADCVRAAAKLILSLGGRIRENSTVEGMEVGDGGVMLRLENGSTVHAGRAVLTPGAWGSTLFPQLGYQPQLTANRLQVVYMEGLGQEFAPGPFPVYLNLDHDFYGFPLDANGLLKTSLHLSGPVIDPTEVQTPDPAFEETILDFLRTYIPKAALGTLKMSRMCMYAMTPNEDFILDRFPNTSNVVLGAGFSGHGFKFGPLIGELLADLLLGNEPEFPLDRFSIAANGLSHLDTDHAML
ncbi:MAG: FAD-dependent oxidoreductase [Chloroflexia bacterium]